MSDIRETAINIGVGVGLAGALLAPAAIAEYYVWNSTQEAERDVIEAVGDAASANERLKSFIIELEPNCAQVVKAELAGGIPRDNELIMRNQTLIDSGVCRSDIKGLTTPLETASLLGLAAKEADEQLGKRERWVESSHDIEAHGMALGAAYLTALAVYGVGFVITGQSYK